MSAESTVPVAAATNLSYGYEVKAQCDNLTFTRDIKLSVVVSGTLET